MSAQFQWPVAGWESVENAGWGGQTNNSTQSQSQPLQTTCIDAPQAKVYPVQQDLSLLFRCPVVSWWQGFGWSKTSSLQFILFVSRNTFLSPQWVRRLPPAHLSPWSENESHQEIAEEYNNVSTLQTRRIISFANGIQYFTLVWWTSIPSLSISSFQY